MRCVVQRVTEAAVRIDGELVGQAGKGFLLLIGVEVGDTAEDMDYIARKVPNLRIFEDEDGKMNRSLLDVGGDILAVSQFTLLGDARGGRRPSFITAARPEMADPMYEALVERWAVQCNLAVFSGSLPPGCEQSYYAALMQKCGETKCVLDASGAAFEAGLELKPYMVKPNSYELSIFAKKELSTPRDHLDAALELVRRGVNIVCVSMGQQGALITDGLRAFYAPPVQVRVKSTVGAGDAMVAGCVKGISDGLDLERLFIQGVAAATACVLTEGTTPMLKEDFERMLPRVELKEMEI